MSRPVATKQAHRTKSPGWLESKRRSQKSMLFFLPHCVILSKNEEFYVPKYIFSSKGTLTINMDHLKYDIPGVVLKGAEYTERE